MNSKQLRKKTETTLLSGLFADYSLVSTQSSNNGFSYLLKKDGKNTYIKVVNLEQEDEEGLNEAELSKISASSRNVIKLIKSGDIDEKYGYLQFEYIEGKDLSKIKKPFSEAELMQAAKDISIAIEDLWKNKIVHRDIKPGNIMRADDGSYKLVDLGIGYYMEAPNRDTTKARGSRYYSSPEQFFATIDLRVEVTFSSDMYSLGMVLYELATGVHPITSWPQKSCYGEVITQKEPPRVESQRTDLSKELTVFINKLLSINPSNRFLSPQEAIDFLNGTITTKAPNRLLIHDTSNNYKVINKYLAGGHGEAPSGVIVSMTQGPKRVKTLRDNGIEVLIDPLTYRLPHALASNSDLKKKLGYKKKVLLDSTRIQKDLDNIIRNVLNAQINASSFILPYFAITTTEDNFIEINKKIWRTGVGIAKEINPSKKVYGGLSISQSITKQSASVDKLINLLFSQYPVDGFYIVFEAPNDKPMTIDQADYLSGIQRITNTFKSMGDVIIGYADISYLFVADGIDIAVGWSTSKRRFLYSHELDGGKTGFMPPEYDPKLLYYIAPLITFVKGEQEAEIIYKFVTADSIDCDCDSCKTLMPFDGKSPKDLELAELHYYHSITQQTNEINNDPLCKKVAILNNAVALARKISQSSGGSAGNKIIPSYEAILSIVNK